MRVVFPDYVRQAIDLLEQAGFEAWAVGGCVRDSLMGRTPHDWDLTTSATPPEMRQVFSGLPTLDTGIQHGTLTVLLDGQPLEITTYRIDGSYADGRHPDGVTFTPDLREDLARRDFIINAMACHPQRGLVDAFGGQEDLRRGLIRCVGEPDRRFLEDALRILRALRFGAVLDFQLEPEAAASLLKLRQGLCQVAAERIWSELSRLLCGPRAGEMLRQFAPVFQVFLPELVRMVGFEQHTPYHLWDVWEHTVRAVEAVEPELVLRLTMLLHDIGKPACFYLDPAGQGHFKGHPALSREMASAILHRLRVEQQLSRQVLTLIQYHDVNLPHTNAGILRWLGRLGESLFFQLLAVKTADNLAQNRDYSDRVPQLEDLARRARQLLAEGRCFRREQLAINGRDLLALGCRPGRPVGEALDWLLEQVVSGSCPNEREALLEKWRTAEK